VVSLPIDFLGREFAEAQFEIVEPAEDQAVIPLHFNPSEYKIKKENAFAEIPIPGLESPPLQYVRGGAEVLSLEVLVDTSADLGNVRDKYVSKLERLLAKNQKLHAPPIVDFVWGEQVFHGVLESLETTYVLFHSDGTPLRAKLALQLKEYRPVEIQLREEGEDTSSDVEKRYVARAEETYSSIAGAVFRDPALWREIARANGVTDPRRLEPGTVLIIPRLVGRRA
jgi:nucleoid-associated protein YgaU